jgi:protein TonB
LGGLVWWALLTPFATPLLAQTPPSPAASAPIADHVKRAAERPYYWIRLNALPTEAAAQRPKAVARPVPKAANAPATSAPGPSNTPQRPSGITERVKPVFDSPALATSAEPEPTNAASGLIATLEKAPPAAGLPPPAVAASTAAPAISTPSAATVSSPPPSVDTLATVSNAAQASGPLKLLSQVEPDFPGALQRRLRQGSVEVAFTVLPDGSVSALTVLRSSHPRLDAPALEAVAQWRFEPIAAPKGGVVEVGFKLDP